MADQQQQRALLRNLALELTNLGTNLYGAGHDDGALGMYEEAFKALTVTVSPKNSDEWQTEEQAIRRAAGSIAFGEKKLSQVKNSGMARSKTAHADQGTASNQGLHMTTRMISKPLHITNMMGSSEQNIVDKYNLSVLVFNLGLVHHRRKSYHRAEQLFSMSLEAIPQECYGIAPGAYAALNNLGNIAYMLEKHQDASIFFRQALQLVCHVTSTLNRSEQPNLAESIQRDLTVVVTNHAMTQLCIGQAFEDNQILDEAMALYVNIVDANIPLVTQVFHQLQPEMNDTISSYVFSLVFYRIGKIHYTTDEMRRAVQAFKISRDLRRHAFGDNHEDIEILTHDIGVVQWASGQANDAMNSFKECLERRQALHGKNSGEVAEVLYQIGKMQQDSGEYHHALDSFTNVLRIEKLVFGAQHPDVAVTLKNIGQCFYSVDQLGLALEAYMGVLAIVREALGENNQSVAEIQNTIGTIYMDIGNGMEAAKAFAEARRVEGLTMAREESQANYFQEPQRRGSLSECAPAA